MPNYVKRGDVDTGAFFDALDIHPLTLLLLYHRGVTDKEEAEKFLSPSYERDIGNPLDIYGMKEAVARIIKAIKEGEKIAEGQPIIRMDDRSWKAQLVGLRAELDAATKDLDRKKALLSIEGSTQEEIDGIFSRTETLSSQIKQLEINVQLANVVAPFSGSLGLRNFSKGAYLKEGEVITVITQMNQLKVSFSLAQEYQSSMKVGKTVKVIADGDTLEAKVYAISPLIDANSRTISVRAMLQQKGGNSIMPGTFAEVLVATDALDDALLVPTQAVVPEINDQTVFIYRNGKVERKIVKLGGRSSELVHIVSGISAGDTVLTTGLLQVKEGMNITLQTVRE